MILKIQEDAYKKKSLNELHVQFCKLSPLKAFNNFNWILIAKNTSKYCGSLPVIVTDLVSIGYWA